MMVRRLYSLAVAVYSVLRCTRTSIGNTLPPCLASINISWLRPIPGHTNTSKQTHTNTLTSHTSHLPPHLKLSGRFGNLFYIVDSDILFIAKQLPFYTQNRWLVLDKTLLEIMVYLYILVFSNFLIAGRSR